MKTLKGLIIIHVGATTINSRLERLLKLENWDLVLINYSDSDYPLSLKSHFADAKFPLFYTDKGKLRSCKDFILSFAEQISNSYAFVWLPDEDVDFDLGVPDLLLKTVGALAIDLCEPSLSRDGIIIHNYQATDEHSVIRQTNFCAMIAPCFSVSMLFACIESFGLPDHALGIEYIWQSVIRQQGLHSYILDLLSVIDTQYLTPFYDTLVRRGYKPTSFNEHPLIAALNDNYNYLPQAIPVSGDQFRVLRHAPLSELANVGIQVKRLDFVEDDYVYSEIAIPWMWTNKVDRYIQPDYVILNDALVYPDGSLVVGNKYIFADLVFVSPDRTNWLEYALFAVPVGGYESVVLKSFPVREISGTCFLLNTLHYPNFAHFLYDALTRSLIADNTDIDFETLVIGSSYYPIQEHIVRSIYPSKEILIQSGQVFRVERCIIPRNLSQADGACLPAIDWACRALRRLGKPSLAHRQRIYVSRGDVANRNTSRDAILNLPEVEALLERFKFKTVLTSKLQPDEQIDLFASCSVIVGVHGAGMLNAMLMPSSGSYIEIALPDSPHWAFRVARRCLKHAHAIACEPFKGGFVLNIDRLRTILETLD